MENRDQELHASAPEADIDTFEKLYGKYYVYLCMVALHIVRNKDDAEEIVSDVFIRLWNSPDKLKEIRSMKAYLVKAVHNTSLNYIEHNRKLEMTESLNARDLNILAWDSDYPLGQLYEEELLDIIMKCIEKLPDSCRKIFLMSRDKNLKYNEISDKLGISVNTVKTQIKIALCGLREEVSKYMVI